MGFALIPLVIAFASLVTVVHSQEAEREPPAAQPPAAQPPAAHRIRVPLPLRDSTDRIVKQKVQRILSGDSSGAERPVIVFEFWSPEGSDGRGSEFERALSLARFLTGPELDRVRTVAFIPKAATGHAVLVALACEEIIMSEDAILGDAGAGEPSIGPTMRGGYAEISRNRRTVPEAIALGMLDPKLTISQVTTGSGVLYAWPEELERLQNERNDIQAIDTLIPAGQMGIFRGDKLRSLGMVSYLAEDVPQLASALQIPADRLTFDPSMGGAWIPIQVEVDGPIVSGSVDRVIRTIQREMDSRQVNFICLRINSPGGDASESVRLGGFLADLDPSRVRTVAYIPEEARSDAVVIALACDQTVVAGDAILGGPGAVTIGEQEIEDLTESVERIAEQKSRSWSITLAMIDPSLQVYRYTRAGSDEAVYLSADEFATRFANELVVGNDDATPIEGEWVRGEAITTPGKILELDGRRAEQVGFARFVVNDFNEFTQLYQLEDSPDLIGPNWAFEFIDKLASPEVAGILLFIGAFALMAELSSPGLGAGGFLAALCFTLYFWANYLNGTAEILEILLFVLGLSFIVIEIFVIPGFGVFGLGGAAMVLLSLVLAVQTFVLPTNSYQYDQFGRSLAMVASVMSGIVVGGFVLRKYLHRAPFLGRVMLMPPDDDTREELSRREALVDYDYLVDELGTTQTQLTPSGKARFGDVIVDVISDGDLIRKGESVRVIEVFGSRVVVEAVTKR